MKNNYEDAYYVEHASMESDTLERIELFGPFKWLVCAEEKQKVCEGGTRHTIYRWSEGKGTQI